MFTSSGIPILTPEAQRELQNAIERQFSRLTFRRVKRIHFSEDFNVIHFSPSGKRKSYGKNLPSDKEQMHKEWQVRCQEYYGTTLDVPVRDDVDPCIGQEILFSSKNYAELDITKNCSLDFDFKPKSVYAPQENDLLCGIVSETGRPTFEVWFNCSDQFLRAWTMLMHDEHESFKYREPRLKKYMFSGNRLCTHSFLKWKMAHQQNRLDLPPKEISKRFYHLRTEFVSRQWVHVYAALVLMVRYGELPCTYNIPNNANNDPKLIRWNLPSGFVTHILKKYTSSKPTDWGEETWVGVEHMIRRKKDFPRVHKHLTFEEFPPLTQKQSCPVSTQSLSWADIVEEEESLGKSSLTDSSPSEGGISSTVYVACPGSWDRLKIYDSEEKVRKFLYDSVLVKLEDLHLGGEEGRKHGGSAEDCELCSLRKFKLEKQWLHSQVKEYSTNGFKIWYQIKEIN